MKVTCVVCGRVVTVKPSNVKDVDNYHCRNRDCHREYMRRKYGNPKTKPTWNWSHQRALTKKAKELQEAKKKDINPSSA